MTTAVEFLWNKLEEIRVDLITKSISNEESAKQRAEAFEQAKAIEEEQKGYSEEDLKQAFNAGFNVGYNDETSPSYLTFEKWFEKNKNK
jgi:hypothetical protein